MSRRWDVVIVGAGIHGAGIAQAAAAAGHTALVLEQNAIAAGSSSRSSKLIHGGLRYLESGQLRLVRESLHERKLLLRLAPELVHLQKFFIPVYRQTRRRPWQLRTGLSLYALLAGLDASAHFGTLPRRQWAQLDGLATQDLQQVFWYHDGQTDDALLTAAVMRSAQSLGAELALPAQCLGATLGADAVRVRYRHEGAEQECEAGVFVNAAGAWARALAQCIEPRPAVPALELVQGSHLVYEGPPQAGVYYVESPRDSWWARPRCASAATRPPSPPAHTRCTTCRRCCAITFRAFATPRSRSRSRVSPACGCCRQALGTPFTARAKRC